MESWSLSLHRKENSAEKVEIQKKIKTLVFLDELWGTFQGIHFINTKNPTQEHNQMVESDSNPPKELPFYSTNLSQTHIKLQSQHVQISRRECEYENIMQTHTPICHSALTDFLSLLSLYSLLRGGLCGVSSNSDFHSAFFLLL